MDINQFLLQLLSKLSKLDFIEKVDIQTEVFILKGHAFLKKNYFLQIYFNENTGTTAFALINKGKRIWGIDFDNIRGWHLHPLESPETHSDITQKTIKEIIEALAEVWVSLK